MSTLTLMAAALDAELQRRGVSIGGREVCKDILRAVIDSAAEVARAYETSHPGRPQPPSGRALDGGCVVKGDASAVDFSERELFRTTAERIVKVEQAKCVRNGIGMATGCIRHVREGDCGHAGGSLVDAIAHALEDAAGEMQASKDPSWTAYPDGSGEAE
jgi:hypothetical protein